MKAKIYCIAYGCLNNTKDLNLTFFTLPKNVERRRKWLALIDRPDILENEEMMTKRYVVCSEHFESSCIKRVKHLKNNAVPTILSVNSQEGTSKAQSSSAEIKGKSKGKGKAVTLSNYKKCLTVGTQTQSPQLLEKETQTSKSLTDETPRKRKG